MGKKKPIIKFLLMCAECLIEKKTELNRDRYLKG